MRRLVHLVAGPVLEAIADTSFERRGDLVVPSDDPVVHAVGPDADRVLLMGSAAVRGVGVVSNDLGLGGHLARRLSKMTGRGVDLELGGSTTLTAEKATSALRAYDLRRFDAIILMLGSREAIGLMPVPRWRREIGALIAAAAPVPQVFVIGIPDFSSHVSLPAAAMCIVVRRAAQFDLETEAIARELPGVEFVPFSPAVDALHPLYGTALYEHWARTMAPRIADRLDPALHRLRPADPIDEQDRQRALDALDVIGSETDERFDSIARLARDLLGASGAAVTFLDHDRQWIKSAASMSSSDTARASSFCDTTISRSQMFVVEDATREEAFAGHPWVVGTDNVRFYAGYPLEAPDGVRVGALCVVDTKPRQFSATEAALLRELALRVQALLWSKSGARRGAS